ncbi:hypothetical protein QR680_016656 [Steinernema hermaphroditum]|uniref:Uncharacterized protein n=1 Tax=Steinernema hermaphroditum TaxID=289476 RepID=A0AA39LMA9_9BILA|nr:hypothetical protein QR680_016656 [Steinernema hermaphroditum]
MNSLPVAIVEQIVYSLPCGLLKESLDLLSPDPIWHPTYDWAANQRARLRVTLYLPGPEGAAFFYKLEKNDQQHKSWTLFPLADFLKYPDEYVLESVCIAGQPCGREFKRKHHIRVDVDDRDSVPTALQLLLGRPFAVGPHSTLKLSCLDSSFRHVAQITRLIRREFQILSIDDVFGHPFVIESILTGLLKSASLRKLAITSADCGDNLTKLVQDLVFQPKVREVTINGDTIDFQLGFFRAVFKHWQSLREFRGRVSISVPSSISEYAEIKTKGRRQLRKTAHFHFSFRDTHRYGFKQQRVDIQYT